MFVYDSDTVVRSRMLEAGADRVSWRPDDAGLFWRFGDQLWYADVPDGTPRLITPLPTDAWIPFDVGWLTR